MSTESKGPEGAPKGGKAGLFHGLRRVRFGIVLLTSSLLVILSLLSALYVDRRLVQYLATDQLRQTLERDFGLELRVAGSRVSFLPLRVVIEGVALRRGREPWSITVEETELSISLYALVFQRSSAARVTLLRPRYFHRLPEAGDPMGGRLTGAIDLPVLIASGLPIRGLRIEDGEVRITGGEEQGLSLDGLQVSADFSRGRVLGSLALAEGVLRRRGVDWELGKVFADVVAESEKVTLRELKVDSILVKGRVTGTIGGDGALLLEGSADCNIAEITELLGHGRGLEGTASFRGEAGGKVGDPWLSGRLALMKPVFGGERWPGLKGTVSYRGRRLQWKDLTVAGGDGSLGFSGAIDLGGEERRYSFEAVARNFAPTVLPPFRGSGTVIGDMSGRFSWEGEGFSWLELAGSGSLDARFLAGPWKAGEIAVAGEATLKGKLLEVDRLQASSGGITLTGRGSYRAGEEFSMGVRGGTDDLAALVSHWGVGDYGGRVRLEGEAVISAEGVTFEGPVNWDRGRAYNLEDFDVTANLGASRRWITISDGLLHWKGGEIRGEGTVDLSERQLDVVTSWQDLPALETAALFGVEGEIDGLTGGHGRVRGDWNSPRLTGRFHARKLKYGGVAVDEAAGNLAFSGGDLQLSDASFRSGASVMDFAGLLQDDGTLTGTLESGVFELRDFIPATAADVSGTIAGRLDGTLEDPRVRGKFGADKLSYETWSFKGGQGTFEYGKGAFTLRGHLAEQVNRFRITVVPAGDWPFETVITLERFSPELAREGFMGLPPKMRDVMEGLSFLAVGEFASRGRLRDVSSISADLQLETVWVYTEGQTLQNLTPVHFSWEGGDLTVDPFTLAGENYRFSVAGGGGAEPGWDLNLDGVVNLSMFQPYWEELEAVDAPGKVTLRVQGPWDTPEMGGKVTFRGGSVKLRSLPEPIVDLAGDGELRENSFSVTDLSGTMGKGSFIAGGSYDFESHSVDALVEGVLDLALFGPRVPVAREMQGPVRVHLSLKGPAARPGILGEARLEGAEVRLHSMPEMITGLTGTVLMEEGRLELQELTGRMGSGDISLNGELDWRSEPAEVDFVFTGRKLTFVAEDTVKAILNTDLFLTGDFEDLNLTGKVDLLRARYFREFKDKLPKGLPLAALGKDGEATAPGDPAFGELALDVTVAGADRLWISNSMAELENSIDIHLGGTVGKPLLSGEIKLLRGTVTYFNRRFTLYSGRIFNEPPGIDPVLEAQAEVSVNEIAINLLLEGPLRKPSLQLTSVPPLSQEDLFALLTVGQTRSDLEGEESEALAIGAAVVLTTPFIGQVGETARDVAGVEFFQVEPSLGEEKGGAKVTVGRRISDRLFMSASQNVGVTQDQQVRMEYQLIDYLSILGQQLQQGIYSLDLVLQYGF